MDNQKHKSFPDKEQLKATYEKRVKSWSELFAKVFKIQKIHVEFLESGFLEKRLHTYICTPMSKIFARS